MFVVTLLAVTSLSFLSATTASSPHISYSDLQSGPNTQGQNNQGVFVTLYGVGFGSSQGSSRITIGGGVATSYPVWSDSKIVFQVGANAVTGNVIVQVNGVSSNGVKFTVRAGHIYFVSPNGSDAGAGTYSDPWKTPAHARTVLVAGDTVYLMDGVQQTVPDSNSASLSLATAGSSNSPIAIVAYPGATATIGSATSTGYGIYAANAGRWIISGLQIRGANEAVHLSQSSGWRLVGNDLSCPNASTVGGCLDGISSGNIKVYGNRIHDSGAAKVALAQYDSVVFTDSNGLDIGWNEVARTNGCRAIHTISANIDPTNLSIHDNWVHDSVCSGISLPYVDPGTSPVKIFNNVIARAGTGPEPGTGSYFACISVGGTGNGTIQIQDNTLYDCGAVGNSQAGALGVSTPVSFNDNVVDVIAGEAYLGANVQLSDLAGSNNLFNGDGSAPSQFSTSLNADPQFVDPAHDNYQLQSSSPAIDAGMATGIDRDILGVIRPQASAYDIGAYEFIGASAGGTGTTLTVSPTNVNFGTVNTGSTSTIPVTLNNSGASSASIDQITVSGTGFSISGIATPYTLAAGASVVLNVSFAPPSDIAYSGTLTISSNASNATLSVPLSGTGTQAPQAQIVASPTALNFGNVNAGATSTSTVTLTNSGNASASISQVSISGAGFTVGAINTPYTLAAGASVALNVSFAPNSATSYSGTLTIASDASDASLSIPLSGSGTQAPQAQLAANPGSVNFGGVNTGSSSTHTIALTNTGNANATINQLSEMGSGFSVSTLATPFTLAPGATVSFTVTFTPTSLSAYTGTIGVISNASNSTLSIPLSGSGTQAAQPQLTPNPATVAFSSTAAGSSGTQNITLTNSGTVSASISQVNSTGTGFSVSGITVPYTLSAGASVSFQVKFTPSLAGSYSGTVSVVSNASNSPLSIPLSGSATHSVSLTWTDTDSGIAGYNVYRGSQNGGPYSKMNGSLITTTSLTDGNVQAGQTYYYVVTAVSTSGTESAYSGQVSSTIPTP